MIELEHVTKTFATGGAKPVRALQAIVLRIERGEMVAIRGASGSGKSSLLNILGCLDRPTSGRYLFEGHDVAGASDRQLSRLRARRIGFIFQSFHLLDRITALEQVELPALYQRARAHPVAPRERARALLTRVGLADRLRHYPSQLSGGEQQRVAVARALMNDPSLILADEPTGNLDVAAGREVMALLAELREEGRTVILVTHDDAVARRAQRQVLLRDGNMETA